MVDILLRDLESVVRCGAIQSRNQVTLLTSFLHFSCHEDEEDFAYFAKSNSATDTTFLNGQGVWYFLFLFSSLNFLALQIDKINTSSNNLCSVSILPYVWYILDKCNNTELYRSFPSLVVGQIEEEDSSRVTRESEDIKWGGNRGIPTCVGAAGYQRGWESIAMCVNLPETML